MSFPRPPWLDEALEKYRRKLHHVKLTKQIRDLRRERPISMLDRAAAAQARLHFFTQKIKRVMDRIGVYADMHPSYIAYALALDKSQAEMEWMVDLVREWTILRQRWEARGLDTTVLDAIDNMVIYRGPP